MALFDWQLWQLTAWRRKQRRGGRQRPAWRGGLAWEVLESRLTPAVSTWSGAVSNLWSDNGNWDVPPAAGNDLVFPAGAANLANTDDLPAATSFGSLTIAGSGYTIDGNAIALSGTVDSSQPSGSSEVDLPLSPTGTGPLTITVDQNGSALVLGGAISGADGLIKSGAGVLDLTGASSYGGTTNVTGGVLDVDSDQPGGPVTLGAGTTLGGSGTVGTITSSSATVSPGNPAPGLLTDGGDLNLDSGSTFTAALNGATAGSGYSQLAVSGQVNLGNATLDATAGFTPADNASFTIIAAGSPVNGTFAGLSQGAMLTISGQPFTISYTGGANGDDVVLTSLVASTATVSASSTSVVSGEPVTLTATVASADSSDTDTPSGTVEFLNGSTSLGTATLSGGTASLLGVVLPVGTDSVTAQYLGDSSFAPIITQVTTVTVSQATTTTTLSTSASSIVTGQSATLTATVAAVLPGAGTPTGMVDFFSGEAMIGTAMLDGSGTATLDTSALTPADTSLTATYEGDANFTTSASAAVTVSVAQATTDTTVTVTPNPSGAGQTATLTATVTAVSPGSGTPTGTVEFFNGLSSLGTADLVNGVASLPTTALALGANSITAQYSGDPNYVASTSAAVTANVAQASTTTLVASPTSITFGQSVTLTATVAAADSTDTNIPTGTVEFMNGSTSLGTATLTDGTAAVMDVFLPAGTDSVTVIYQGDTNFAASTSPEADVTVAQSSTTTTLASSVSSLVSGQSVTLTATVAAVSPGLGTPTGTVEFFSGTTSLGTGTLNEDGIATLNTSVLTTADTTLTATYGGDDNFTTSTSSAVGVDVSQASTTTSVTVAPNPSTLGSSVTLTATVAVSSPGSGSPTGSVQFFNGTDALGTATLSGGVATFTTSTLTQGSNSITAQYMGDSNFTASTSPAVTATVNLASTTSLIATPASFTTGQTITLTATVTPANSSSSITPTGTVEFFNGSTSLGSATLTGGVAVLSSVSLTATSALTATYEGDTNYTGSTSAAATVPLVQSSTTTVTTSPNPSVVGQAVTLAAAVTGGDGAPTGTIMFLDGAVPLGVVELDSSGSALLTVTTLPAGSDSITAQYSGDSINGASTSAAVTQTVSQASSTTTLTVAPLVSSAGQAVTLSVNVAATSAGGTTPTGTVTFLSGSTTLGTATLDANGNASLVTTTLPVGTSTITAQYSGDSNFLASTSAAVTPTVSEVTQASTVTLSASTTNPSAFSSVQFTATVAPAGTTTTTPTGTVVFFANGAVIGTATLDSSGSATFSTSDLALGSESILAVYQGDSNYSGSATAPLAITVGTADELFVNQMYLIVLDRTAEQAGLSDWTTGLQDGLSRHNITQMIMDSPEAKSDAQETVESTANTAPPHYLTPQSSDQFKDQRINELYEEILGRPADPVGLQFYINVVNDGFSGRVIMIDLLGSDEYYSDITNAMQAQASS